MDISKASNFERFVFDLPLGRVPVNVFVRGWFQSGASRMVNVYALNESTGLYDQLTNTTTGLLNRNNELAYTITLPRDYADNTGGVNNVVTLEFRSTSTTTGDRLRIDQILVSHVAEDASITFTAPSAADIWSYVSRTMTTPGVEPVTPPTSTEIADVVLRRTMANAEASADGDALSLHSLYGMIQMAQAGSVSGSTLMVKKTDLSTTLGTLTVTASAGANPITAIS